MATILMSVLLSCDQIIHVDTNQARYTNSNEFLKHNCETLHWGIQIYKKAHNGNSPFKLNDLIEENILDEMPINPVTQLPMVDVKLSSQFKAGNFTYLTYPIRYKQADNTPYIATREHLLIVYHDGDFKPIGDMNMNNTLLDSIASDILITDGEVMHAGSIGMDTICPTIEQILDYNGYTLNQN